MATFQENRDVSTAQLIRDLLGDVRTLVRQEVALARAEIREELRHLAIAAAASVAAAGALAVAGLWMLIAVTRTIAHVFNWPLAAVYAGIGLALAIIGLVLIAVTWRLLRALRMLPRTRATLRNHAQRAANYANESA
jgi:Putative Actinobacterial Holin-X, holin superfamily III